MPSVPLLRVHEVVRAFERGSHIILTKSGSVVTLSVPERPQVGRGTLRASIAEAGLTVQELVSVAG